MEASKTEVLIHYEEYYESKKETPDLSEEIKAAIQDDIFTLNGHRIRIYELKADYIAFYISKER